MAYILREDINPHQYAPIAPDHFTGTCVRALNKDTNQNMKLRVKSFAQDSQASLDLYLERLSELRVRLGPDRAFSIPEYASRGKEDYKEEVKKVFVFSKEVDGIPLSTVVSRVKRFYLACVSSRLQHHTRRDKPSFPPPELMLSQWGLLVQYWTAQICHSCQKVRDAGFVLQDLHLSDCVLDRKGNIVIDNLARRSMISRSSGGGYSPSSLIVETTAGIDGEAQDLLCVAKIAYECLTGFNLTAEGVTTKIPEMSQGLRQLLSQGSQTLAFFPQARGCCKHTQHQQPVLRDIIVAAQSLISDCLVATESTSPLAVLRRLHLPGATVSRAPVPRYLKQYIIKKDALINVLPVGSTDGEDQMSEILAENNFDMSRWSSYGLDQSKSHGTPILMFQACAPAQA